MRKTAILSIFLTFLLSLQAVAQSLPEANLKLAAEYSNANKGVSMLVMEGDKITFEDYNKTGTDRAHFLASGTKSFSGVMLAAAIEDRLISGFDEKLSDTLTEWKSDPRKSQITYRQLLSLTSGLDAGQIGKVPTYAEAILAPATYAPGTHFEYGPVPFQTFGEAMTRKLKPRGETVMQYLKRRILVPIGLDVSYWRMFDGNQPLLPQGANLEAREWVKFGLFLKNGGKWNGRQIVAKRLLDQLVIGSKANPAYGITFWLNNSGLRPGGRETGTIINEVAGEALKDLYMAAGAGNQRLYIIPSKNLVVVRFGNFGEWDDRQFLGRLIYGVVQ